MSTLQETLKPAIDYYHSPKMDGDIDLVTEVRNMLVASGLLPKVQTCFDTNRFIIEASGKASDVQRFLLNRYWSQQLMSSSRHSIEERYCLIPDGTITDWLHLFQTKVLPFIIANDLPTSI